MHKDVLAGSIAAGIRKFSLWKLLFEKIKTGEKGKVKGKGKKGKGKRRKGKEKGKEKIKGKGKGKEKIKRKGKRKWKRKRKRKREREREKREMKGKMEKRKLYLVPRQEKTSHSPLVHAGHKQEAFPSLVRQGVDGQMWSETTVV